LWRLRTWTDDRTAGRCRRPTVAGARNIRVEDDMAEFTRVAEVSWQGDLAHGRGVLTAPAGGVLSNVPVTWKARTETPDTTNPEELIASAHAACYAMALSHTLTQGGHAPDELRVSAEVTAMTGADGLKIVRSALRVRGRVAGLDQAAFAEFARKGEQSCPVSNALRGNIEITVDAQLEG
jgi:osmotically inducible protein OsmC